MDAKTDKSKRQRGKAPGPGDHKPYLPGAKKLPTLGQRERSVLAAIRAGARSLGGIEDRMSGAHGHSRKCVQRLLDAGAIEGVGQGDPAEGPWRLTDRVADTDFRGARHRMIGQAPLVASTPVTRPEVTVCPHGRVSCALCAGRRMTPTPAPPPIAGASYEEAERAIKTPIAIVARTSDTLLM